MSASSAPGLAGQPRPPGPPGDDGERRWLERGLRPTIDHVCVLFAEHPEWVGVLGYDEYRVCVCKRAPAPWGGAGQAWTRIDSLRATRWVAQRFGVALSDDWVQRAVTIVAHDSPYNSLRDEVRSYRWDGVSRIDGRDWLHRYGFAAESSRYTAEVGARFLVSAAARAISPGCKVDHVLVLEGIPGALKSTAIEALATRRHYCDSPIDLASPFAPAQLRATWFYEMPELVVFRAFNNDVTKAFISRSVDDYSPKNEPDKIQSPRTCVFVGTTNESRYLRDPTGNRRTWPLRTADRIDVDLLARERESLIAEAVLLYDAGFRWHLSDEEEARARDEQDLRYQADAWEETISRWMEGNEAMLRVRGFTTVSEVLEKAVKKKAESWGRADQMRVAEVLSRFGWRRGRKTTVPGMGRVYPYECPTAIRAVPQDHGDQGGGYGYGDGGSVRVGGAAFADATSLAAPDATAELSDHATAASAAAATSGRVADLDTAELSDQGGLVGGGLSQVGHEVGHEVPER